LTDVTQIISAQPKRKRIIPNPPFSGLIYFPRAYIAETYQRDPHKPGIA
jgi:hypothetical protein